jgi:hypothetical protein
MYFAFPNLIAVKRLVFKPVALVVVARVVGLFLALSIPCLLLGAEKVDSAGMKTEIRAKDTSQGKIVATDSAKKGEPLTTSDKISLTSIGVAILICIVGFFAAVYPNEIKKKLHSLTLRNRKSTTHTPTISEYQTNIGKLREILKSQYQARIDSKLSFPLPINILGRPTTEGTSREYAEGYKLNENLTIEDVDIANSMYDIIKHHHRLLLTGDAGSGKTTILLKAAVEMLTFGEHNEIPLMLNLATWNNPDTFGEWYERIIAETYTPNREFTKKLLADDLIVPFFDGFDEIAEKRRESLLEKMFVYFRKQDAHAPEKRFVISSRKLAYNEVPKDAPIKVQYEVLPLTFGQITTALEDHSNGTDGTRSENALLLAIKQHEYLRQAVLNPFYLNTASFLYNQGRYISGTATSVDEVEVEIEIVNAFVESQSLSGEDKHYLGFLAGKMKEENLAVFELLDIQSFWSQKIHDNWKPDLSKPPKFNLARCLFWSIGMSLIMGLITYVKYGPLVGWFAMLLFSILGFWVGRTMPSQSLLAHLVSLEIATHEKRVWSWNRFQQLWKVNIHHILFFSLMFVLLTVMSGGVLGLLSAMFSPNHNFTDIIEGLKMSFWAGCILGMFLFSTSFLPTLRTSGIINQSFFYLSSPYQRFRDSLRFSFLNGMDFILGILGFFFLINFFTIFKPTIELFKFVALNLNGWKSDSIFKSFLILLVAAIVYFTFSRLISHFTLRYLLYQERKLPLRIVTFLDRMIEKNMLEDSRRVVGTNADGTPNKGRGATWRFRHKILQDWFAAGYESGSGVE